MAEFKIIKQCGAARLGEFKTVHGTVKTPAFQNVATCGAIKGALDAYDLKDIHAQVQLCNTYHLHVRPGDELIKELGGLHRFTGWDGPILTDSGGRNLCLPHRRQTYFYGTRRKHEDSVKSRFNNCNGF